jgi:tetratricopeptide (TPR) repeat protein
VKLPALLTLAAVVLVPATALAQSKEVVAEALFQEGKRLMAEGKYTDACPKLAESNRLDPGAGALTALALCHKAEGKWASSWSEFKDVVSLARRDGRKDREQVALASIAELEPKLSRLVLEVDTATLAVDEELLLDDTPVARAAYGQSLPADPGVHRISARAPGRKPWETTSTIAEKKDAKPVLVTVRVPALELLPVEAPVVAQPLPPPTQEVSGPLRERGNTQRIVSYAVGGAGIVALGIGTFFGIRALSKNSDSDQLCGDPCASQAGLDANDSARSSATVANIAIGLGLAAVAGGVVLWLTAPKGHASSPRALSPVYRF